MEENKNRKARKGVGRKSKSDPAVYRYGIKFNSRENAQFELSFQKSGMAYRARFIKSVLLNKEIKVVRIDKAAMDYYVRLTNFYHQFQAVGNNYNQAVKAIKTNFGEKRAYALLRNLEKVTIDLVVLSKRIIMLTREFEETYLIKKQREEERHGGKNQQGRIALRGCHLQPAESERVNGTHHFGKPHDCRCHGQSGTGHEEHALGIRKLPACQQEHGEAGATHIAQSFGG